VNDKNRGKAAGLKSNVSMASLLKWRLSLASYSIEELEPILWTLQQGMIENQSSSTNKGKNKNTKSATSVSKYKSERERASRIWKAL
jgi:hypothetical protein